MKKIILLLLVCSVSFFSCGKEAPIDNTPKDLPEFISASNTYSDSFVISSGKLKRTISIDIKNDFKVLKDIDPEYLVSYINEVDINTGKSHVELNIDDNYLYDLKKIKSIIIEFEIGNETLKFELDGIKRGRYDNNKKMASFLRDVLTKTLHNNGIATLNFLIEGDGDVYMYGSQRPTLSIVFDAKFRLEK